MGITRKQYLAIKPWKKAQISRHAFEARLLTLDQDLIDEARISVETETLVEALFGQETAKDLE